MPNSKNSSSNMGNNHINFNNNNKKGLNQIFNKLPFNKKVNDKVKK